jgi:hypothetical protein
MGTEMGTGQPPRDTHRRTIPVTCRIAGHSCRGFCNLRVTKIGGDIELDPHVTGACVIVLDETAAAALFDVLRQWLG